MNKLVRPFHTLLVANRGEVALRVMKSARRLGLVTVAVYSEADRASPHVAAADRAVNIGAAAPRASYLNIPALIDAARRSGADAVHPGYGFLAENEDFAAAAEAAGLVFVGPPAEVIRAMGNKAEAKRLLAAAGMPCIPGYQGADQSDAALMRAAAEIGFPVMVKAAAGGGGRGMRLVHAADELAAALASARSEAVAGFGSDELILERALLEPRHIEIQILADAQGHTLHLGERDCSVQRRHQKLIEEAPSPALNDELRRRMGESAVRAVLAIGYVGAGTMEFLLERDGRYHFMEMNTRLQVEHAVTEAVTGLDLVEWQLRIAAGEPLALQQHEVCVDGHAIEVRLTAEDVSAGFLPRSGALLRWRPPQPDRGVRVEHALAEGGEVSPHYDSMVAKLIAHGRTRDEARRKLLRAVQNCVLLGPASNQGFLADCLADELFAAGGAHTGFVEQRFGARLRERPRPQPPTLAVAALLALGLGGEAAALGSMLAAPSVELVGDGHGPCLARLTAQEGGWCVALAPSGGEPATTVMLRDFRSTPDGRIQAECDGITEHAVWAREGRTLHLFHAARAWRFEVGDARRRSAERLGDGALTAPLAGRVVAVGAAPGEQVAAGRTLVVMEAMKMEHVLTAPFAGRVAEMHAQVGAQVGHGRLLVRVER